MKETERCELCGTPSGSSYWAHMRHLRTSHPAYARGLVLRMVAPFAFLVMSVGLAAVHAPLWLFGVALVASIGLVAVGWASARRERVRAGLAPSPSLGELLNAGGFRFLLIPVVLALLLFMSRR